MHASYILIFKSKISTACTCDGVHKCACKNTGACIHACAHQYTHMHTRMSRQAQTQVNDHTQTCIYTNAHKHMHMCECVCICMHIKLYICACV